MAESLKLLRRRLRSVSNVRQITRAMEMVSGAKLRRAHGVLSAGRSYARKMQELLSRLAGSSAAAEHPLFEKRSGGRATLVLFTADRGLCGSFNTNLIGAAERFAVERGRENVDLYCVGRKGLAHFTRRNWAICGSMTDFSGTLNRERSDALGAELLQRFTSRQANEVFLLYSAFVSSASFRPTVTQFLSLDREALTQGAPAAPSRKPRREIDYIFEPSAAEVFDSLLPRYLQSKVYITFAEQFTSEHSARMLAMHNATTNCEDLLNSLRLRLNKARQSTITKELLDIVGGAEALKT